MNLDSKGSGHGESSADDRRKSLGRAGELVARVHLERNGYRVLAENYRKRNTGEIDLVVCADRMLVFVEVKTRSEREPVDLIVDTYSETQMNRLFEISEMWIAEYHDILPLDFETRFDMILVGTDGTGELEVKKHIADAFRPV